MPEINTDILKDLPTQTFVKRPEYVKAFFFSREMAEDHLFDSKPLPKGIFLARAEFNKRNRTVKVATFIYKLPSGEWSGEFASDVWLIADDHNFWTYAPEAFGNVFQELPAKSAAVPNLIDRAIGHFEAQANVMSRIGNHDNPYWGVVNYLRELKEEAAEAVPPSAVGGKYGVIWAEKKEFHPGEPVFLLRASDKLATSAIEFYANKCREAGCDMAHLRGIIAATHSFASWAAFHPEHTKRPD